VKPAPSRAMVRALAAAAVALAAGACAEVWGIPERQIDKSIVCTAGGCTCAAGYEDCDGKLDNGCEANLTADQANCGACGAECKNGACEAAVCQCDVGWGDCDEDPLTGCETDITVDLNCGGCGLSCENAACAEGVCVCSGGFSDCDADPSTCEAHLEDDPANCGACGHDCVGGGCTDSHCEPVIVADTSDTCLPGDMAVKDGTIYLGCQGLETLSVNGGPLVPLLADTEYVNWLALTGDRLYYSDSISLKWTPYDASAPPTVLATDQYIRNDIVVTATHVYWWNGGDGLAGELRRVSIDGGPVEKLADAATGFELFANSTHLYWSDYITIFRMPLPEGPIEAFAEPPDQPYLVAADDEALYRDRDYGEALTSMSIETQVDTDLIVGASPMCVVLDQTLAYALDGLDGTVKVVPKDGSLPAVTLATGIDTLVAFFPALDQDETAVYWLVQSSVGKVAK
jgi:hypothetical protein